MKTIILNGFCVSDLDQIDLDQKCLIFVL